MVFSSVSFLFFFLPLVLTIYLLLNLSPLRRGGRGGVRIANLFLLLASLVFYSWGEGPLVAIMLGSTAVDYLCGLLMTGAPLRSKEPILPLPQGGARTPVQKTALVLSITSNLFLLCLFKYFGFFVENARAALSAAGLSGGVLEEGMELALPMGISFYTFQSMSYTIDVYRGRIAATRHFIDFACFVTLFPQLIAGPIVRYKDLAEQLVRRVVRLEDFSYGARRFILGLGKKVLIADALAVTADRIYALPLSEVTCSLSWLGTVCFTLQLYFDFSGYSDMAIGLGRMLGFRFPENFNYPFIARSLREYWSRWHITLGAWFRDYLFFPLGGSRVSPPRVYLNLLIVFFLCGLWHGASWTYVIWGLYHGAFLMLERFGLGKVLERTWRPLAHGYLTLVNLSSKVLFRSATMLQAGVFLKAMAGLGPEGGGMHPVMLYLDPQTCVVLVVALLGCMPVLPWLNARLERLARSGSIPLRLGLPGLWTFARLAAVFLVFALSLLWAANVTYTPFIYFKF